MLTDYFMCFIYFMPLYPPKPLGKAVIAAVLGLLPGAVEAPWQLQACIGHAVKRPMKFR